jgi:hypothetical protein
MIDWIFIESNKQELRNKYLSAKPFPHLVIKDVCENDKLEALYEAIPELEKRSRDYMFAGNKFEKSHYFELGDLFKELYEDLRSDKMNRFLSYLSGKKTFVDRDNHGGGLHQGKKNSFLDMHLDYNYHPLHENWWREMNLLLYLNKDWKTDYGGHLKIRDLRTDETAELEVDFNTLIIQQCGDYTLHGYDPTNFPEGSYRTSIATYAFTEHVRQLSAPRTTDWFPEKEGDGVFKKWMGRNFHKVTKIKNAVFGSGTAKNR